MRIERDRPRGGPRGLFLINVHLSVKDKGEDPGYLLSYNATDSLEENTLAASTALLALCAQVDEIFS